MNASDKIAMALQVIIENASPEDRQALHDAIGEYVVAYPRSFRDVTRQPFARKLIEAIQETY
jgi:hypothetical protein